MTIDFVITPRLKAKIPQLVMILKRHRDQGGTVMLTERITSKLGINARDLRMIANYANVKNIAQIYGTVDKPRGYVLCLTADEIAHYSKPIKHLVRTLGVRAKAAVDAEKELRTKTQMRLL